jgi:antitoxin component of MazEF toxin-antitoxin module
MVIKRLQRIGNSTGLVLPRDVLAAADLAAGDEVLLAVFGRRIVLQPASREAGAAEVRAAYDAVLRDHGDAFRLMARYDRTGRRRRAR